MALIGAWTTGDWTNTATWRKLLMSANMSQASVGNGITGSNTISDTYTATSLVDGISGFWLPFQAIASANVFTVTLQELVLGVWSDTAATATIYAHTTVNVNDRWLFGKFGTPYVATTLTANSYRMKIIRTSGTGTSRIYGSTAAACSGFLATAAPAAVPGSGDDALIAGDATSATGVPTPLTVTVDANATIGSNNAGGAFPGGSATGFPAITLDTGGRLKASRTASAILVVAYRINQSNMDTVLDWGKITDRIPATYNAEIMWDTSSSNVEQYTRGTRTHGTFTPGTTPLLQTWAGAAKSYIKTNYASGLGTAASPLITSDAVDWTVGDQILVMGTAAPTTYAHTAPTSATYTAASGYTRSYIELTFAAPHSFKMYDRIVMAGFTSSLYNGTWVVDEVPTTTTLRIYNNNNAVSGNATVMGTVSGKTTKADMRYIKTKNSSTSYVLCTVPAGADDALRYSPSTSAHIYNMSSNVSMSPTTVSASPYYYSFDPGFGAVPTTTDPVFVMDNVELKCPGSGGGAYALGILANGYTSGTTKAVMNNVAAYMTYGSLIYDNQTAHSAWTVSNIVVAGYYNRSVNTVTLGGYGKTISNLYFTDHGSLALNMSGGAGNIVRDCYSWGSLPEPNGNAPIYLGGKNDQIINLSVQGGGSVNYGVALVGAVDLKISNATIGNIVVNPSADVQCNSNLYNTVLFENGLFGSSTFISNYLNMLTGSQVAFQKFQQTNNKHRWYTNTGSARSTGATLEDTTVRTAGSLNVVLIPENNTTGFIWEFKVPAVASTITGILGYVRKNAAFGTSVAKVELFMPGTDTTGVADAIFTASNTTGTYQDFSISKANANTSNLLALVRITAITATASAYLYVADLYNGQGALNLWDSGKPVSPIVPTDFSSIPGLVWGYSSTGTTSATMGYANANGLTEDNFRLLK